MELTDKVVPEKITELECFHPGCNCGACPDNKGCALSQKLARSFFDDFEETGFAS